MFKLSFHGGAGEVTGANYLLESAQTRILIDCGMFQCPQFCALKNRDDFPYDPASLDALFLTHAHIDHIGRVPKLVAGGFTGMIYSTPPTKDFGYLMLEDSLGVLEKELGPDTIYKMEDLEKTMKLWQGLEYGTEIEVGDLKIRLRRSGHILGSAMVECDSGEKKILFTGDVGNAPMPLLDPPEGVSGVHVMIIESAYGNRVHEDFDERKVKLERAIEDVVKRRGVLIIPAFALERTQELLFEINNLVEAGRIPSVPIYIDSPLAILATHVYKKYQNYFGAHARSVIKGGDDIFKFKGLELTLHTKESKAINDVLPPKVIIAGAGMMTGGRILHHARRYLGDKKNMALFIGYQAAGSLGRRILDGERMVRILGDEVPVEAEVRAIRGYSAHADLNGLFAFVKNNVETLEKVFVVQGEPASSLFFAQRVRDYLGIEAIVPELGARFTF